MTFVNTTRIVVAFGALSLAAVACGGDDATDDGAASSTVAPTTAASPSTTGPATTVAVTTGAPAATEPVASMPPPQPVDGETPLAEVAAGYDTLGTDAAPGVFPRTVRHAAGETTIESRPLRIVTLDSGPRDTLMALGITPVGIADGSNDPAALAEVPRVGLVGEPNFEAIAVLAPDLILTNEARTEGMYDQLSAIAPTVSGIQGGPTWKQDFELLIAALGAETEAEALLERYHERAAGIAALAADAGNPEVSVIRLRADDLRIYLRSSYSGLILDDAGLVRPAAHNLDANHETISLEEIERIDADIILVAADKDLTADQLDQIRSQPLWQALSATQAGQVHDVDSATWIAGGGYFAAMSMLDDLEGILGSYEPA